jgi:uncharacterized membrane protein
VHDPKEKYRVGASAHIIGPEEFDAEITESLENEKIVYRLQVPKMTAIITSILESVEEGTRLTYAMDYEMPWGILGKFLDRLGGRSGEKILEKELQKLKSILEK